MNDENGENNPPNGQNNIMIQALATLAQAIRNLQSALVQGPREQNIAQIPKFYGYGNEVQYTNRFKRTPTSEEVAELIILYTVIPDEEDLKESTEIPKFIKTNA